mmetsp:Transcript_1224/g.2308  ORF Transcript_1224/g.2308 Transcript_1224/m.2308 type:complete len:430 (+) Transcript_1224:267-1556(+)|eukprot:CAMPEP_0167795782 /NCGR_PEP_ID=MMETSP0111_2-20121227/14648_1 /TAXON_ID=91324 /ORGANISM="Lotharella globosa, Strain CCCM811" /LENGTH=429 /DNA_ID=CAMNT_0007689531 /DNA_START=53 /DNA_END=1342 /DNA_ORIENTATION=-
MSFPEGLDRRLRRHVGGRSALSRYCILPENDPDRKELREKIEKKALTEKESRAVACLLGNAVGDALGAPLEFSAVRYGSTELKEMGQKDVWYNEDYNAFHLKPGQWTDDASMGLCIADSLLANEKEFNPRDLRLRFLNWWEFGYNNAFGHDSERNYGGSVGLGGNISMSMSEFKYKKTKFTTAGDRKTSGNGSLMRNGAIAARYWSNPSDAMKAAYQQSKTTHQGDEAAECCRLLTHVCCTAINTKGKVDVKAILDSLDKTFSSDIYSIQCLAKGVQEKRHDDNKNLDLCDRNWTWKSKDFKYAPLRSKQMPGYVGSYSMDNLSMSLHCIYHTSSAKEAMLYCANMRGDSDSVCAVVGQLAGAIYGLEAIPSSWIEAVERWDGGGSIKVRGYKLFKAGQRAQDGNKAKQPLSEGDKVAHKRDEAESKKP